MIEPLYSRSKPLLGDSATKEAFLSSVSDHSVVHFAGHGEVRSESPLLSYLRFAPDRVSGGSGDLYVTEMYQLRLPRTRLVVLSGCNTGTGAISATEGVSSLARPFFAAGVPTVVASLWAVEDETTARFITSFHRFVAGGADPAVALRNAQLAHITTDNAATPYAFTWAAFQVVGGS